MFNYLNLSDLTIVGHERFTNKEMKTKQNKKNKQENGIMLLLLMIFLFPGILDDVM